jgi:hypothetical protein
MLKVKSKRQMMSGAVVSDAGHIGRHAMAKAGQAHRPPHMVIGFRDRGIASGNRPPIREAGSQDCQCGAHGMPGQDNGVPGNLFAAQRRHDLPHGGVISLMHQPGTGPGHQVSRHIDPVGPPFVAGKDRSSRAPASRAAPELST